MTIVKDFIDNNKENVTDFHIFLQFGEEGEVVWKGLLGEIPSEYFENEVVQVGRSLGEAEKGRDAFYLTMLE